MSDEERMLITEIGGFDARLADRVAAVLVAHHTLGVHLQHCNADEYRGGCKYGDADCPALTDRWSWIGAARDREAAMRQFPPLSLDEIARVLHAFDVLPRGASRSDEATARAIADSGEWYGLDYIQVGPDGDEMPVDSIDRDALARLIAAALAAARAEQAERDSAANEYEQRRLIAHIQALIAAHRHPYMYNVAGVLADAEEAWRAANDRLLERNT